MGFDMPKMDSVPETTSMARVPLKARRTGACSELRPLDPDQLNCSCSSWCSNSFPTRATADLRQLPSIDIKCCFCKNIVWIVTFNCQWHHLIMIQFKWSWSNASQQNGECSADNTFKRILFNENVNFLIEIWLQLFLCSSRINHLSATFPVFWSN